MMNVGELIKILSDVDPETPIMVTIPYDNRGALTTEFNVGLIDTYVEQTHPQVIVYNEIPEDDDDELDMFPNPIKVLGIVSKY